MAERYTLVCQDCKRRFSDDGIQLTCPYNCNALLRTDYVERRFMPDRRYAGVARYHRWLPGEIEHLQGEVPVVFQAGRLGHAFGFGNLHVAFGGYWPDRGAFLPSGTFKDLEASAVLGRMAIRSTETIPVLASAGNTAAAFATACSSQGRRCVIVVTEQAIKSIRIPIAPSPLVQVVVVVDGAVYDDAIALSRAIADGETYVLEGGVKNIARRDGVGITMLAAAETLGQLPDTYVQAVGSAAGAVAAYEAAERLITAGGFGSRFPRLALSQNAPYTPLVDAWDTRSPTLLPFDEENARSRIAEIDATVLSNLAPPYAVAGGIRQALEATDGVMVRVTNAEVRAAATLFYDLEGVWLDPAAAVALASLAHLPATGINHDELTLLHLTGGRTVEPTHALNVTLGVPLPKFRENAAATGAAVRDALRHRHMNA